MSFVERLNDWNKSEADRWNEAYAKAVADSQAMLHRAEEAENKARAVGEEVQAAEHALASAERHVGGLNPDERGWREALTALRDAATLVTAHKARQTFATEAARKARLHYEAYGKVIVPPTHVRQAGTIYGDGFIPDSVYLP